MKETKNAVVPEFSSLEEEKEYWEARGPLAEGHKGRINRPKAGPKRSSFLAVRLTGEQLTRLRDIASQYGVGPSTFARLVLTSAIERQSKLSKSITLAQLKDALANNVTPEVKEKSEALANNIAIGDPAGPSFLIIDGSQIKQVEEFTLLWLKALLAKLGVQVITPEDEGHGEVGDAAEAQNRK